jgi:adenylate kinase family enzyme
MPTSTSLRIQVVGTSGSGKSTLASKIADELGLPHLELDSIHHQPGWTPLPGPEFRKAVSEFAAQDSWVIDGNYSVVRSIMDKRLTHIIWLDYPRWFVMWRLIRRTFKRAVLRQELWNGNREHASSWLRSDPEENILLWAWTTHERNRERYEALFAALPSVTKMRIGSPFRVSRHVLESLRLVR